MTDNFPTPTIVKDRSPSVVELDNLVRRKLRVSDPSDPDEIAKALRTFYTKEGEELALEAEGVPFYKITRLDTDGKSDTPSRAELKQAMDDIELDLNSLVNNSLLKDIKPELQGWASAIRSAAAEGTTAAKFALDPRQRDKAMAARRMLGDYARVVRYVGALTPTMNMYYRRLAQSLDETAAVILVTMGDAIANIGFGGGRFLLQAPASELQERRDAVLHSLRNLVGSVQHNYGANEWPRGLVAYRQFLEKLEENGQSDLRALFQENNLSLLMDELIDRAAGSNSDGLRALSATAQMALQRFYRLIIFGQRLVDPEAPPLAAFLSALQLFVDAFDNAASGARLVHIARPAIVSYGLYGIDGSDDATARLQQIIIDRGRLAEMLDCYLGCECDDRKVRHQIILDKVLYDIDRSIDLYALGKSPIGEGGAEQRAAAYGTIIDVLLESPSGSAHHSFVHGRLEKTLERLRQKLWWDDKTFSLADFDIKVDSTTATIGGFTDITFKDLGLEIDRISKALSSIEFNIDYEEHRKQLPSELFDYFDYTERQYQELCIQQSCENNWETLLTTMAPSCISFRGGIIATKDLLTAAIQRYAPSGACPRFDILDIPPHFETSLAGFTYSRFSQGGTE